MAVKPRRVSDADVSRLGPDIAAIKARTDPHRWKALVRYAHGRGFAVGGVLEGIPDTLKPRLQSSLKSEAQRTVADAYRPAEQALDSDVNRISGIADRRRRDEQAFNDWAKGQRELLMSQATAADQMAADRRRDILAGANGSMQAAQENIRHEAERQPDRVSNPSDSRALDLSAVQNREKQSIGNLDLAQASGANGVGRLATLMSAALSYEKAQDAAREGASQAQIGETLTAKRDLGIKRAGDAMSVLQDLRARELDKASANEDRRIAAAKLDVDQAKLDHTVEVDDAELNLKTKKVNLDTWIAHHRNSVEAAKLQLGYDQIAARKGTAAADRELRKWLRKDQHRQASEDRAAGKRGDTAGDRSNSRNQAGSVGSISKEIDRLHSGRTESGKPMAPTQIRDFLRNKRGANDIQIDVANDLHHNKGKLSPRGRRKARALGISDATMKHLGWI